MKAGVELLSKREDVDQNFAKEGIIERTFKNTLTFLVL